MSPASFTLYCGCGNRVHLRGVKSGLAYSYLDTGSCELRVQVILLVITGLLSGSHHRAPILCHPVYVTPRRHEGQMSVGIITTNSLCGFYVLELRLRMATMRNYAC
jgi:hypothetical protein